MMIDPTALAQGGICHHCTGESDTVAGQIEERQSFAAFNKDRHLTTKLMEQICSSSNMRQAYKQVKRNKGVAGVDGMTVQELGVHLKTEINNIKSQLTQGVYRPQMVLGIKIPKPGGGERQLGIHTVVDRFVQQALHKFWNPFSTRYFRIRAIGFALNVERIKL